MVGWLKASANRRSLLARLKSSYLWRRDGPCISVANVIGWWETRRIPFNLIVGCSGILTCIVVGVVAIGGSILFNSDIGLPAPPLLAVFGVLFYGIMANICFTGGWLLELVIRKIWPREADRFATLSFSLGVTFSVLLTLAPAIVIGTAGLFELLRRVFNSVHT